MKKSIHQSHKGTSRGMIDSYFVDLKSKSASVRTRAAVGLHDFIKAEQYARSGESFGKLMSDAIREIYELIKGSSAHGRMGGIQAMDELIDIGYDEDDMMLTKFANYIRRCIRSQCPFSSFVTFSLLC